MHAYRTHTCGALRASDAGATVRLSGWVHRKRDHGGLLFLDLRDHYGLTQCVVAQGSPVFEAADRLRAESVVTVTVEVVNREPGTVNAKLPTGEVELRVRELTLQSAAEVLPFQAMAYTPAMLYLGRLEGGELWWRLGGQLGWAVLLWVAARAAWGAASRRLTVHGG